MATLETLIGQARDDDLEAYSEIVRRFQDMAVGYAYSLLGDCHHAEDVAQEAFIEAHSCLPKLRRASSFPSWFRKIVFKHCDRSTRGRRIATVPLEVAEGAGSQHADVVDDRAPDTNRMYAALDSLPGHQRQVLVLFYISEYSQADIGAFLDVSEKTVKSRLHSARKCLRERMLTMVEEDLHTRRPSRDDGFVAEVMEDLVGLTDLEIEALLRETDQKDLVIALKGVSDELKERILGNIQSRQVRDHMEEWIAQLDPVPPDEAEEIRQRIWGGGLQPETQTETQAEQGIPVGEKRPEEEAAERAFHAIRVT